MAPDNIWSQSLFYNKIYIEILTDAPSSFAMENGLFTNNELKQVESHRRQGQVRLD